MADYENVQDSNISLEEKTGVMFRQNHCTSSCFESCIVVSVLFQVLGFGSKVSKRSNSVQTALYDCRIAVEFQNHH